MWTSFSQFWENLSLLNNKMPHSTSVYILNQQALCCLATVHANDWSTAYLPPLRPQGRIKLSMWKEPCLQTCEELQQVTSFGEAEWWSLDPILAHQNHSATAVHCGHRTFCENNFNYIHTQECTCTHTCTPHSPELQAFCKYLLMLNTFYYEPFHYTHFTT